MYNRKLSLVFVITLLTLVNLASLVFASVDPDKLHRATLRGLEGVVVSIRSVHGTLCGG